MSSYRTSESDSEEDSFRSRLRDEDPPGRPLLIDTSGEGGAATVRVDSGVPHLRGRDIGVAMERSIVILDISAKNEVLDKK